MNFLKTVVGSFYSIEMYRELRRKSGCGLAYSFMLILLTLCVGSIVVLPVLNKAHQVMFVGKDGRMPLMDDLLLQIAEQTPVMTFENNTLTTKVSGQHVIHLKANIGKGEAGLDAITIDTSGNTNTSNMRTPLLITSNEVISKVKDPASEDGQEKIETHTFEDLMENHTSSEKVEIDNQVAKDAAQDIAAFVRDNLKMFYGVMSVVTILVLIVTLYISRIVMVMLLALAGMLIASALKTKATFEELMRLSAVSFTPVALLSAIIPFIGQKTANSLTLFALGVIMLGVVLYATRDEAPAV